jgi:hypothetical protein
MVRVGPWTVTQIEFAQEETHCERCDKRIKYIWVCEVDAGSERLTELNGQVVWRIGSTRGPTLMRDHVKVAAAETRGALDSDGNGPRRRSPWTVPRAPADAN